MLNDDVPELRGLSPEELRFFRLIDSREPDPDFADGEYITLACGHRRWSIGLSRERQYIYCSDCLRAWIDAEARVDSTQNQTS